MRWFFEKISQRARSGTQGRGAHRERVRRLQCEQLESRMLLSVTGGEFLVNSTLPRVAHSAATASSASGRSVVVWVQEKSSTDADIRAQLYDAGGRKIGREILVTNTKERESEPTVAMDSRGNFVVAWTYDFLPGDKDVRGQRFDLNGRAVGSLFRVAYTPKSEFAPSIAMASNGSFVVSYTHQFSRSDTDIHAKRFNASAGLVQSLVVSNSSRPESNSHAAMSPDGRFGILYSFNNDLYLKRYTNTGAVRGLTAVANTSSVEINGSLSADNYGNFAAAWQYMVGSNSHIRARRITDAGALGPVTSIATTSAQETAPSVALDPTNRKYVVSYQVGAGTSSQVHVKEVSASNTISYGGVIGTNLSRPSVSVGGTHRYIVAAQSYLRRGTDTDGGIFGRLGVL